MLRDKLRLLAGYTDNSDCSKDDKLKLNGTLANHPLAELIREISSKALSGTLRLKHERAQTAVYFEDGQLVYAASNLRTLRLQEYLNKSGLVSEKDRPRQENNLSDLALAAALRATGALSQKEVDSLLVTLIGDAVDRRNLGV